MRFIEGSPKKLYSVTAQTSGYIWSFTSVLARRTWLVANPIIGDYSLATYTLTRVSGHR